MAKSRGRAVRKERAVCKGRFGRVESRGRCAVTPDLIQAMIDSVCRSWYFDVQ